MNNKTTADMVIELHNMARVLESRTDSEYFRYIAGILRITADELNSVEKALWACSVINSLESVKLPLNQYKMMQAYTEMRR